METILIIDDEPEMAYSCARLLKPLGLKCVTAGSGEEGLRIIRELRPEIVLTDLNMPQITGMNILSAVQEIDPGILVLIITGYGTISAAVSAIQGGAFDFITKPFSGEQLRIVIGRALKQIRLVEENRKLRNQLQTLTRVEKIVGSSQALVKMANLVKKVAFSDLNVLITGESGTGKEMVAKAIHENSDRAEQPLIPVDCAAIPYNLLESELFGYEKGAFTGAVQAKAGLLELADKGILFLDELAELDLRLQSKLLRVLQEKSFRRLGGTRLLKVDVRVLSATNRDLQSAIQQKLFREDLFYRLNVLTLNIPPLREREGDVPLLAYHFLTQFNERSNRKICGISKEVITVLEGYNWPGNVRELKNVIDLAAVMTEGEYITLADLPEHLIDACKADGRITLDTCAAKMEIEDWETLGLPFLKAKAGVVEGFERRYLESLLARYQGNISRTAVAAGIDRKTIHRLINKYNLTK